MSLLVIDDRCTACGACIVTCPERALVPAPRLPHLLADRCTACLGCIEVCPRDAITERDPAHP
ncbi:MAG: 4Fe-4S binding protein [Actinomycetota bacterium]|nr:4Fe-4S binding protein [Actinomycetota bacterium]